MYPPPPLPPPPPAPLQVLRTHFENLKEVSPYTHFTAYLLSTNSAKPQRKQPTMVLDRKKNAHMIASFRDQFMPNTAKQRNPVMSTGEKQQRKNTFSIPTIHNFGKEHAIEYDRILKSENKVLSRRSYFGKQTYKGSCYS